MRLSSFFRCCLGARAAAYQDAQSQQSRVDVTAASADGVTASLNQSSSVRQVQSGENSTEHRPSIPFVISRAASQDDLPSPQGTSASNSGSERHQPLSGPSAVSLDLLSASRGSASPLSRPVSNATKARQRMLRISPTSSATSGAQKWARSKSSPLNSLHDPETSDPVTGLEPGGEFEPLDPEQVPPLPFSSHVPMKALFLAMLSAVTEEAEVSDDRMATQEMMAAFGSNAPPNSMEDYVRSQEPMTL